MKERKFVFWGAGNICRQWLESGFSEEVVYIIDSSKEKQGTVIEGIPVISPQKINNWKEYFVIIVSNYSKEISTQLEKYGLKEGEDFVTYKEYYNRPLSTDNVIASLAESVFNCDTAKDIKTIARSKREYDEICEVYKEAIDFENVLNSMYKRIPGKRGAYPGKCGICNEKQDFTIDYFWTDGSEPAWRETVFCPQCNCNSRMRFLVDYLEDYSPDNNIYLYERVTTMYQILKERFPYLIGSEYLGDDKECGKTYDGILHEDALNLSFGDNTFDCMISADVFEHVADYKKAFREAFRCLKKNGKLIFSIPIFKEREKTVCRTRVKHGRIEYVLPKVFHGNPLNEEGSLVFFDFGWDVIDELRNIGFRDAYAIVYFSVDKGYFGRMPVMFEAIK